MDFAAARHKMVENQIRANGIADPRIARALGATPREAFLPAGLRGVAYVDEDIAIGGGRVLIEPLVFARLLVAAAIAPSDVVLTIGDATGWASAVVSRLANTVVSLETDPDLVSRSSAALAEQGVDNVAVVRGDLAAGLAAQGPYDAIVVLGAVAEIPAALASQLVVGGRLVAVVDTGGAGKGVRLVRSRESASQFALFDAATPYLPGFALRPRFKF